MVSEEGNPFYDKGYVHFFDEKEIRGLFSKFKNVSIELSERTDRKSLISHFIITAGRLK